eukprot:32983-Amorphochlora_amoeboformis.AAC.2
MSVKIGIHGAQETHKSRHTRDRVWGEAVDLRLHRASARIPVSFNCLHLMTSGGARGRWTFDSSLGDRRKAREKLKKYLSGDWHFKDLLHWIHGGPSQEQGVVPRGEESGGEGRGTVAFRERLCFCLSVIDTLRLVYLSSGGNKEDQEDIRASSFFGTYKPLQYLEPSLVPSTSSRTNSLLL